ncbi:Molybdopterin molybdenumtransferase [Lacunisphaera limnophila]|uniref:Molybdopterin molybdenumtransferase n=1 Tax=Lacunisphaera limnophila TaxID=1838286 RepID=A0A1D8AV55_9BACT|nr:molybdopterin molybdotransferase MoeA [Lacunisphaera limnophila]AOS44763.1 Molybdopterin molybdenumtransferase [Lacunisphaera limnophila]
MELIPVPAALHEVLARAPRLGTERVPLAAALSRVLREPARADLDSPPFDASAMDGYAVNASSWSQGDPAVVTFRLLGESAAGAAFTGTLAPGECVRIFTGAPVPAGADRVVKQEDTTREGAHVRMTNLGPAGRFIRRRGENRRAGDVVVAAGARLGPPELAALASAGVTQPLVTRRPRAVHIVTGNELVPPHQTPAGAQIRDSNSSLIAALLAQQGTDLVHHAHLPDDLAAAQTLLAALPDHDVLLISGGASVGDHDFARPVLTALGYALHFQQINLRPGKPLVFASRGERLAFALPGNPVSHWVTFQLFVAPLLQKLTTGLDAAPPRRMGRLAPAGPLPPPDARQTIWPARADWVDGEPVLTLLTLASSGDSSGLVGANALVPLPANGLDATRPVEFIPC